MMYTVWADGLQQHPRPISFKRAIRIFWGLVHFWREKSSNDIPIRLCDKDYRTLLRVDTQSWLR